jgi:hypothetical protein
LDTTIRTVANFELYKAELAAHTGPYYEEAHAYDASAVATPTRTNSNKMLFGVILSGVADPTYKSLILDAQRLSDHPHNTASAALMHLEKALLGDKEERDTRLIREWDNILLLIDERLVLFAARFNALRTALRVAGMDKNNTETHIRLETALRNHPQRRKQLQDWRSITKHQSEQHKTPSAALKHLQEQADMEERNTATSPPQQQTIALMGEVMGSAEDATEIGVVSVFIADRGRLRLCFRCALPVTDGHTFRTCTAAGAPVGMSYDEFAAQQNSRRPAPGPKGGKGGRGGKGRGGRGERRPAGFLADGASVYDDDEMDDTGEITVDIPAHAFGFMAIANVIKPHLLNGDESYAAFRARMDAEDDDDEKGTPTASDPRVAAARLTSPLPVLIPSTPLMAPKGIKSCPKGEGTDGGLWDTAKRVGNKDHLDLSDDDDDAEYEGMPMASSLLELAKAHALLADGHSKTLDLIDSGASDITPSRITPPSTRQSSSWAWTATPLAGARCPRRSPSTRANRRRSAWRRRSTAPRCHWASERSSASRGSKMEGAEQNFEAPDSAGSTLGGGDARPLSARRRTFTCSTPTRRSPARSP